MPTPEPFPAALLEGGPDEMVSGQGGIRPHWRGVIGVIGAIGRAAVAARGQRLTRAMLEEGVASILPGATGSGAWRLDPVPLPLEGEEFEQLATGIVQRARLLDAVLADVYGPQNSMAEGHLPAPLVFGSPAFVRAARRALGAPHRPLLHLYAVDLLRGADGRWAVLQDRTGIASGLGQLRENRRLLGAAMPEAMRTLLPRSLGPFFDLWQDALSRLAPHQKPDPAVALLSPGTTDPHWFEHVVLSRELGCALVEPGDLTVRGGALFLKTLAGLQSVDVVLSRMSAEALDPLDQPEADAADGVPGILDAARHGALTLLNAPGAGLGEMPALPAFLPGLCRHLLDEDLLLPSLPTHWLRPGETPPPLPEGHAAWAFRPAGQGDAAEGWAPNPAIHQAAIALPPLPVAPALEGATLNPAPVVLRMFAVSDGTGWQVLPGGLARLVTEGTRLTGRLPGAGWCKDVWVPADPAQSIIGPAAQSAPPLPIRRTPAAIPSRVADNLFWLGRYVERLDRAARLLRATIARLRRGGLLPRELAELGALTNCLREAGLVGEEARVSAGSLTPLAEALNRDARPGIRDLQRRIGGLMEAVRDRLTADMHATFTQTLRAAEEALAPPQPDLQDLQDLGRALIPSLRFANAVAGVAAENMVRGGARLFLELGRRMERAQAVASEVSIALDGPPARIEAGLRLVLELCDSVITYRSRYLGVLQPAPALDLVLADGANPRGLAFQLQAIADALSEVSADPDDPGAAEAERLLAIAEDITPRLLHARDQAAEAALLPPELRRMAADIGALSDVVSRRYFALLPPARAVGVDLGEAAVIEV